MAVAVVQTAATSSATTNPTLKYQARPTAGDFLLAYCMQESAQQPGLLTDTAGNPWEMILCAQKQPDTSAPNGLSVCIYRVPLAKPANTTVTFPTVTDSMEAVQEFSGVLGDLTNANGDLMAQPGSANAGFASGTDFYIGANPGAPSSYCQALIVALDQTVTWALDTTGQFAGWTLDRTFTGGAAGSHVGLSGLLAHQVASSYVLAHLTASKPTVVCVIGASLSPVS